MKLSTKTIIITLALLPGVTFAQYTAETLGVVEVDISKTNDVQNGALPGTGIKCIQYR
jgi:hypothetical protein